MKQIFLLLIFVLSQCQSNRKTDSISLIEQQRLMAACQQFESVYIGLNKDYINIPEARIAIDTLLSIFDDYYFRHKTQKKYDTSEWYFPVQGYTARAIGNDKKNKHGFVDNGCNFFDRGINPGHPAYDIFIRDLNNDGKDDRTKEWVNILAMTGGIVVDVEEQWKKGTTARGGKYIWLYDPSTKGFFYYAHNNDLYVKAGDIVTPGQVIATMGRTGANANKERSQTHLHLCYYQVTPDNDIRPMRFYPQLKSATHTPRPSKNVNNNTEISAPLDTALVDSTNNYSDCSENGLSITSQSSQCMGSEQ